MSTEQIKLIQELMYNNYNYPNYIVYTAKEKARRKQFDEIAKIFIKLSVFK